MHLTAVARSLTEAHPNALILVFNDNPAPLLQQVRNNLNTLVACAQPLLLLGENSASFAQLVRSLAAELGPSGIRANGLAIAASTTEDAIAETAAFLMSDDASYVTGVVVPLSAA